MLKDYKGTIVKESLKDTSILKGLQITGHTIVGRPGDTWDLVSVSVSLSELAKLKYYIKEGPWYANFWNDDETIIVFNDRIFTDEDEAKEYGQTIGVPIQQLDFKKD